jgi:hypothetical protein
MMLYFDRFDIVEAYYVWLSLHHCGIVGGTVDDPKGRRHPDYWRSYNRLSWLPVTLGFKPRPNLAPETLSENGQEIYRGLCERAGGTCDCDEAVEWKWDPGEARCV